MRGDFGTSISLRARRPRAGVRPPAGDAGARHPRADHRGGDRRRHGDPRRRAGAARRSRPASTSSTASALSIPDFLWGLMLILLFGVLMPIFDISGRVSPHARPALRHASSILFESIVRLRFDLTLRPPQPHADAGDGAGAAARRDDLAAPEDLAEGGDAPGLCRCSRASRAFPKPTSSCARRCATR